MDRVPSLLSLCQHSFISMLSHDVMCWTQLNQLPIELIEEILLNVSPLVLEALHEEYLCSRILDNSKEGSSSLCSLAAKRKRDSIDKPGTTLKSRFSNSSNNANSGFNTDKNKGCYGEMPKILDSFFNVAWEKKFRLRWPKALKPIVIFHSHSGKMDNDSDGVCKSDGDSWQQNYWEAHLQECLNEAAAQAIVPSYAGFVPDISISDRILKCIGFEEGYRWMSSGLSTLEHHYNLFGHHVRHLRIRNVLCTNGMLSLFRKSKIKGLTFQGIRCSTQVHTACKILQHHAETLESVELYHCRISSKDLSNISACLLRTELSSHQIRFFSLMYSRILACEDDSSSLCGFLQFLLTGRHLHSLKLYDNGFESQIAMSILNVLCQADSRLHVLELCENSLSRSLCPRQKDWKDVLFSPSEHGNFKSLSVLRLRGNHLKSYDLENLRSLLLCMPKVHLLDLSDNPIEDDGIRELIPFFQRASEMGMPLRDLKVENCNISSSGARLLLECLLTNKVSLRSLAISHNTLGSSIAEHLGSFLRYSHIKTLEIEDIGLGPYGFNLLQQQVSHLHDLVYLNMSKNRGSWGAAAMLSKILSCSSSIQAVDSSYNFLCLESLKKIANSLQQSKGQIEWINLLGNDNAYNAKHLGVFDECTSNGKLTIVFPPRLPLSSIHDDDP